MMMTMMMMMMNRWTWD